MAHGLRTTGDVGIFARSGPQHASKLLRAQERYGYTNREFELEDFTKVPSYLSFGRHDGWFDIMTFTLGFRLMSVMTTDSR
jgi:hypothetical protein